MDSTDRGRQRQASAAELQDEQLDWLHELHEEAAAQTDLMRQQSEVLQDLRHYIRFIRNAVTIWFVITLLGLIGLGVGFLFLLAP